MEITERRPCHLLHHNGPPHIPHYESAEYMFGRVNTGAPSNLSPESDAFKQLVQERIAERKEKLASVGYTDESAIPDELLTSSGSGVDPHISPATAYFQVNAIIAGRKAAGWKLLTNADGNVQPIQLKDGETAVPSIIGSTETGDNIRFSKDGTSSIVECTDEYHFISKMPN